jgi:hypothetical protein
MEHHIDIMFRSVKIGYTFGRFVIFTHPVNGNNALVTGSLNVYFRNMDKDGEIIDDIRKLDLSGSTIAELIQEDITLIINNIDLLRNTVDVCYLDAHVSNAVFRICKTLENGGFASIPSGVY